MGENPSAAAEEINPPPRCFPLNVKQTRECRKATFHRKVRLLSDEKFFSKTKQLFPMACHCIAFIQKRCNAKWLDLADNDRNGCIMPFFSFFLCSTAPSAAKCASRTPRPRPLGEKHRAKMSRACFSAERYICCQVDGRLKCSATPAGKKRGGKKTTMVEERSAQWTEGIGRRSLLLSSLLLSSLLLSSRPCSEECSPHFCSAGTVQQPASR